MKRNAFLRWSALMLVGIAAGYSAPPQVSDYTAMKLSGRLSDSRSFILEIRKVGEIGEADRELIPLDGGSDRIGSLTFQIDGKAMELPPEAFKPLRNVRLPGPYVMQSDDNTLLVIPGGDGGEAYTYVFAFKDGKLVRRDLYKPPLRSGVEAPPTSTQVY